MTGRLEQPQLYRHMQNMQLATDDEMEEGQEVGSLGYMQYATPPQQFDNGDEQGENSPRATDMSGAEAMHLAQAYAPHARPGIPKHHGPSYGGSSMGGVDGTVHVSALPRLDPSQPDAPGRQPAYDTAFKQQELPPYPANPLPQYPPIPKDLMYNQLPNRDTIPYGQQMPDNMYRDVNRAAGGPPPPPAAAQWQLHKTQTIARYTGDTAMPADSSSSIPMQREWASLMQPSPPSAPPWQSHYADSIGAQYSVPVYDQPIGQQQSQAPPKPQEPPAIVVSMRRHDAWARFAAYEGCMQVCLSHPEEPAAQAFQEGGFKKLREDLGIGSLLLAKPSLPDTYQNSSGGLQNMVQDICWDDLDGLDVRLGVGAAGQMSQTMTGGTVLRVRIGRLQTASAGLISRLKRWATKRHTSVGSCNVSAMQDQHHLVVYATCPTSGPGGGAPATLACPLDARGCPLMAGPAQTLLLGPEHALSDLQFELVSQDGPAASGSVPHKLLWQLAQQADLVEESSLTASPSQLDLNEEMGMITGRLTTVSTKVQLTTAGNKENSAELVILVQRVNKTVQEVELPASVIVRGDAGSTHNNSGGIEVGSMAPGGGTGGKGQMLRLNSYMVYDCTLKAALVSECCGRSKLEVEGPWRWLLHKFTDHFGVRPYYCILIHLRWVLDPSVSSWTSDCLVLVRKSMSILLAGERERVLTQNEVALLEVVKRGTEGLLKDALESYYTLGFSNALDSAAMARASSQWEPGPLQAALQLYHELGDCLQPSKHDWLALRFHDAACKRWRTVRGRCNQDGAELVWGLVPVHNKEVEGNEEDVRPEVAANQPLAKHRRNATMRPSASNMGGSDTKANAVYTTLCTICTIIKEDVRFDLGLMMTGHLPQEPYLPRATAEEYCNRFLEVLKACLLAYPPALPTPQAVGLLVAVAEMQRHLEAQGLCFDARHPGHLDALQLFKPHVLAWIAASQGRLIKYCSQLEGSAQMAANPINMGQPRSQLNQVLMLDALPGAACPLVAQMSSACTQELGPYHPVISHWPAFAPHLETAMCRVVRCTQAALTRLCQMARGNAVSELPGNNNSNGSNISNMGGPGNNGGPSGNPGMHQRSGSLMPGGPGSMGANNSSNHNRSGSLVPPSMRGAAGNRPETGMPGMGPLTSRSPVDRTGRGAYPPPLNSPGRGPAPAPRMSVLLKEAVLLNSLKHLMVLVPSMEATLQQCCATVPPGMAPSVGSSAATTPPLAPPGVRVGAGSMVDDMTLGAQFAQVVKELRTEYANAVALCAGRLADVLRASPPTNVKAALSQPMPNLPPDSIMGAGAYFPQQVSSANAQRQFVEELMGPICAGVMEALAALRGALDARVFVATGRALWDYVGKDLYEFVEGLQEVAQDGSSTARANAAWRARQHASLALERLDVCFREAFNAALGGSAQQRDLRPPAHVDRVHKLLERSDTTANMNFTPF